MAKKKNTQMNQANKGAPGASPSDNKVDFDAWHALRASKIPRNHRKEIIKADFRGRGLGQLESLADFDAALEKYGVKLA